MLPITSTSSPSTAAAFAANAWWRAEPRPASLNRMTDSTAEQPSRPAAISGLTTMIIRIAPITAMHGGSTFHAIVFSDV